MFHNFLRAPLAKVLLASAFLGLLSSTFLAEAKGAKRVGNTKSSHQSDQRRRGNRNNDNDNKNKVLDAINNEAENANTISNVNTNIITIAANATVAAVEPPAILFAFNNENATIADHASVHFNVIQKDLNISISGSDSFTVPFDGTYRLVYYVSAVPVAGIVLDPILFDIHNVTTDSQVPGSLYASETQTTGTEEINASLLAELKAGDVIRLRNRSGTTVTLPVETAPTGAADAVVNAALEISLIRSVD